mmetsp:Transcript_21543/g.60160  ORF Transcript_21543/g.60160 Transcript_21543/m.60160 type:complete len:102 (+) Transcript_21543:2234-2539(+)
MPRGAADSKRRLPPTSEADVPASSPLCLLARARTGGLRQMTAVAPPSGVPLRTAPTAAAAPGTATLDDAVTGDRGFEWCLGWQTVVRGSRPDPIDPAILLP